MMMAGSLPACLTSVAALSSCPCPPLLAAALASQGVRPTTVTGPGLLLGRALRLLLAEEEEVLAMEEAMGVRVSIRTCST